MIGRWRAALCRHAAVHWPSALLALCLSCALVPLAPKGPPQALAATSLPGVEWPTVWNGQLLRPLALSAVEQRFAAQFPGRIARFALADQRELVLREVNRPTRMLHPAADCWRGIGWRIESTRLQADPQGSLWRCFEASHGPASGGADQGLPGGARVRVCERIVDAEGRAFTDTSAWFWAASLGRSRGPWRAVTRVEGL